MKIGLYVELLKVSSQSGISRHIKGLVQALMELDDEHEYLLYFQAPLFGKIPTFDCPTSANVRLRPVRFPERWLADRPRVWWDIYLPWILTLDRIDVFHGPNHFIPTRGRFKKVITIHDLAYFYMNVHGAGMDRILQSWTRKCLQAADKVVAVSDATKRDCIQEGVPESNIQTIYQGFESKEAYQFSPHEKEAAQQQMALPQHYLLFIGTLQPRKNLAFLLEAFAKVAHEIPHQLVLAGAKSDSYQELLAQAKQLGVEERVIFTGYVSDLERVVLYENASVFIYPSQYEGFGLVLLEAMSYDVPVITTNISSLPEVGGDAAAYIELDDVESFAITIKEIACTDSVRQSLIEKGRLRQTAFLWEDTAKNTLSLYRELCQVRN